jgi:hypothetical protein
MVLFVTIDKFNPSPRLVNINKLKPYVPYDSIIKGLVSEFQRGKKDTTTLETQEIMEDFVENKGKN